jgi:hypothetical protein
VLTLPDGQRIVMHAPEASPATPYIHTLAVSGVPTPEAAPSCASPAASTPKDGTTWKQPWLPSSIITTGGTLAYGLSAAPDPSWGSAAADSPPSFGTGRLPAVGFSNPSGGVTVPAGRTTTVQLGLQPAETGPSTIRWSARGTGLLASPSDGAFAVTATNEKTGRDGLSRCAVTDPAPQVLTIVAPTVPGTYVLDVTLKTSAGQSLPPVVLDVTVTA